MNDLEKNAWEAFVSVVKKNPWEQKIKQLQRAS